MKVWGLLVGILIVLGLVLWWFFNQSFGIELISPLGPRLKENLPLKEYSFEELRKRDYSGSEIKLEKVIKEEEKYTSWLFSYFSDGKKVTGMANVPRSGMVPAPRSPKGVVVMLRGYADDSVYFTGLGTRKAAGVFAENGFVTLAPDFLGFGGSDSSSVDILEARFNRPVEVLNLLASIKNLPLVNPEQVFLWAHSNGGQIALSVLEISQRPIPTTLWAPVTKGFPESVLVFMDDPAPAGDDLGRKVRKAIEEFEQKYDTKSYSIDNYFADINAPLQIHQGEGDSLVPKDWSTDFVNHLQALGKKVKYYQYPKSDHNLKQDWETVVALDLEFFQSFL